MRRATEKHKMYIPDVIINPDVIMVIIIRPVKQMHCTTDPQLEKQVRGVSQKTLAYYCVNTDDAGSTNDFHYSAIKYIK